ncbi:MULTISPECIES: nuclear transport factor 2 family protein [unclassified Streptomyces]|uniref:nuclear transport factor 2 family protein n=1 Tax=unclassified Streptomyces TaxID=2593676 RepID=UPI001BE87FA3|nr:MULTISPECIES: nuclear transport factor 2 family protein [unclassified Streptomyces]MBT2402027.1 nuclear transport factor 2 family protein [Streptomyces sp. ISL-21]MBT2454274.1 nuclear transport factor 2 family protein [Streptomyces sp. ISL-86]MBT2609463.1 nuclear transport factor 2 family protein [Streptomyces sp. ISL-87]
MTFNQISDESATESAAESRAQVAALLDRYLLSLDDEELDAAWAEELFTKDAVVAFPMNQHEGIAGMPEYHSTALSAFAATQHLGSSAVVVLDGDRASLRANLISTHVHHARHARPQGDLPPIFATGTFVNGEARRTERGWRLTLLSFRLLWADGSPAPAA